MKNVTFHPFWGGGGRRRLLNQCGLIRDESWEGCKQFIWKSAFLDFTRPNKPCSLHRFPNTNANKLAAWKLFCRKAGVNVVASSKLCCIHFKMESFYSFSGRHILRRDAIPSLCMQRPSVAYRYVRQNIKLIITVICYFITSQTLFL